MPRRRILSLWFPRLAAERVLRLERGLIDGPLAIVQEQHNAQTLASLSVEAEAEGLRIGQGLTDARALCPTLLTRLESPMVEAAFLTALRRWAGKFSPWVNTEGRASLVIDLTGCAHLFGGEEPLLAQIEQDCIGLGISAQAGVADTVGAAWALARFAGQGVSHLRSGDAIAQEARATRSKAARRHWVKGGRAPVRASAVPCLARIAPPGRMRGALTGLPIAALRLSDDAASGLIRLGIRQVGDLTGLPRATVARRFGRDVVQRLDQALGMEPEPISPARAPDHFAVRLSLPEPIGLETDVLAAIDRLLPSLEKRLRDKGRGVRRLQLQLYRSDHTMQSVAIGLARSSASPERMRPLLRLKLGDIDPGFGIDRVRLWAEATEPLHEQQHKGHFDAADAVNAKLRVDSVMDDLLGRIGARVGLEAITRLAPADSNIPEKSATIMAAAFSDPVQAWPAATTPRPIQLFPIELVTSQDEAKPPRLFRWRRRDFETTHATGPERLSPEWWLDDPNWRSGVRDYWRVITTTGEKLWLFHAHGALTSGGWFCQGDFG